MVAQRCRGPAGFTVVERAESRGLRRFTAADVKGGRLGDVIVDDDLRDVRLDRYGRVWR
jgi:hypothetical protein